MAWINVSKNLNERQSAVISAMKNLGGKATMHQVAAFLNVGVHTVSPRFSELFRKEMIIPIGKIVEVEGQKPRTLFQVLGDFGPHKNSNNLGCENAKTEAIQN